MELTHMIYCNDTKNILLLSDICTNSINVTVYECIKTDDGDPQPFIYNTGIKVDNVDH